MSALRAAGFWCLALSGCATTSNSEWLSTPVDAASSSVASASDNGELTTEARPRLSHTVTLGESYADSPSAYAAPAGDSPPVQVNVHTQVPVIVNNYGGFGAYGYYGAGYGYPSRSSVTTHGVRSTESKVGADFPAPPDYGPRAMK
jgi:hypothetical protein